MPIAGYTSQGSRPADVNSDAGLLRGYLGSQFDDLRGQSFSQDSDANWYLRPGATNPFADYGFTSYRNGDNYLSVLTDSGGRELGREAYTYREPSSLAELARGVAFVGGAGLGMNALFGGPGAELFASAGNSAPSFFQGGVGAPDFLGGAGPGLYGAGGAAGASELGVSQIFNAAPAAGSDVATALFSRAGDAGNPLLFGADAFGGGGAPAWASSLSNSFGEFGSDVMSRLNRAWRTPMGRMALLRSGAGLYGGLQARRLNRRLRNIDVTQTPGYRAGERAIIRRASAGGYADSTRMLAELSDYGQQSYDRFAANERANLQANLGGLMTEMNALGMLSLGLGF